MNTTVRNFAQEIRLQQASSDKIPSLIGAPDTIDALRHELMFRTVKPIIASFPEAEWLTVGDGGADGWMLRQLGASRVTASSISIARLEQLQLSGHLAGIELRELNAEAMDLPDASVDLVLCKEAFHHFPHAPLAFYEFLRVARRGFLLIEPIEFGSRRLLDVLRSVVKLLLRRRSPIYELFEPVGNFIYRVSPREIERMLTAIQVPWFAIHPFNDFGTPALADQRRNHAVARAIFELAIWVQDTLAGSRLMTPGLAAIFVPVGTTSDGLQGTLRSAGFRIIRLPRNPYGVDDYRKSFLN
jgi:ubiquinone/menaquinone biosynthesis C-methylase UbiE